MGQIDQYYNPNKAHYMYMPWDIMYLWRQTPQDKDNQLKWPKHPCRFSCHSHQCFSTRIPFRHEILTYSRDHIIIESTFLDSTLKQDDNSYACYMALLVCYFISINPWYLLCEQNKFITYVSHGNIEWPNAIMKHVDMTCVSPRLSNEELI